MSYSAESIHQCFLVSIFLLRLLKQNVPPIFVLQIVINRRRLFNSSNAPHQLQTHRKKRRAGHLQDRPWSRAARGE